MVSASIAGNYAIYIINPSGQKKLVKSANNAYWDVVGLGSPDGAISTSATPDKWNYLPPGVDRGAGGYYVEVAVTAGAAKTMDISDGVFMIPVNVNGQQQTIGNPASAAGLGNTNFVNDLTQGDNALVAGVETPVMRIRAKEGVVFSVGGDKVFLSVQDNTA